MKKKRKRKEKEKKKKRKGFTLIELVVTVAIIAVLAAFIYSRISLTVAKAKDARALSSVEALRKASLLYFTEQEVSFSLVADDGEISQSDLENLIQKGYIESKALKAFIKTGENTASIEVGSAGTSDNCGIFPTPGYIPLKLENDGIGIGFDTETYDSGCKEWKNK